MAHDAFITYSSEDKPIADAVCHNLENNGIRCWMAPRDILPGIPAEKAVINAINESRIMIIILSSNSNASSEVENEVKIACRKGIAIVPLRIENVSYGPNIEYYLSSTHWLDAITPPIGNHLNNLTSIVQNILGVPVTVPYEQGMEKGTTYDISSGNVKKPNVKITMEKTIKSFAYTNVALTIWWVSSLLVAPILNGWLCSIGLIWGFFAPIAMIWYTTRTIRVNTDQGAGITASFILGIAGIVTSFIISFIILVILALLYSLITGSP